MERDFFPGIPERVTLSVKSLMMVSDRVYKTSECCNRPEYVVTYLRVSLYDMVLLFRQGTFFIQY